MAEMTVNLDPKDAERHQTKRAPRPSSSRSQDTPVSVQIVSTLLFGGFSIAVVAIAFDHSWPAAVALAALLGWRGGFAPNMSRKGLDLDEVLSRLDELGPKAESRRSGNTSFDAYRTDVIERLEQEQEKFEGFLTRLRDAKDKSEFDQFMEDRAQRERHEDER
jgi:hypothetical protein